jgi:hypothetical protein
MDGPLLKFCETIRDETKLDDPFSSQVSEWIYFFFFTFLHYFTVLCDMNKYFSLCGVFSNLINIFVVVTEYST